MNVTYRCATHGTDWQNSCVACSGARQFNAMLSQSQNPQHMQQQVAQETDRVFENQKAHEHHLQHGTGDYLYCQCGVVVSGECLAAAGFVPRGTPSSASGRSQFLADEAQKWRDEAAKLSLELRLAQRELARMGKK